LRISGYPRSQDTISTATTTPPVAAARPQTKYALRAGVEGTIRQGIAVTDLRHSRYRGLAKTHLQHVFSAVAPNLIRPDAWWNGHPWTEPAPATSPASNSPSQHDQELARRIHFTCKTHVVGIANPRLRAVVGPAA
jgi:hypothetical protein